MPLSSKFADPKFADPKWWKGCSPSAVAVVVLIVFTSAAPWFVGYLFEPRDLHFTGGLFYHEDVAQHEAWASEMAAHFWYQNLLTPDPTPRGWFLHPLDMFFGLIQRAMGLPYMALWMGLVVVCAPALAFALMHLARRAGLSRPGIATVVALLAGSFAPLVLGAQMLGLIHKDTEWILAVGGEATPISFAVVSTYLLPAILVLIAIPLGDVKDPERGFRLAGVPLAVMGIIYPFFVPTLLLTAILCALLWAKGRGWKSTLKGIGWLCVWSGPPMMYWALLPHIDSEYARFAAANRQPLFSIPAVLVCLGLSVGAIVGIPRLLRANAYQQVLGCFAAAFVIAFTIPAHPWRAHLFMLSPILMIGALAAWWPLFLRLQRGPRWILIGSFLAASILGDSYYYARKVRILFQLVPPVYISSGDVAAIQWIANQPGIDVVLARYDLSPFVASRGHHRVLVGQWLWTHQYERRRAEVAAVFENGADPRSLLKTERVAWVLIDGDRGVPAWAEGVEPAARFGETFVLRADWLIEHLESTTPRTD
jgi:hypothetical protein